MDIVNTLNKELFRQPFIEEKNQPAILSECRQIASVYSRVENAIAVLSDLKSNTSYIYYGGAAEQLGLSGKNRAKVIDSIWEEEIFSRIHPDDLLNKHLMELQFFHLIKGLPEEERSDYYIDSNIRMLDSENRYRSVQHRMFYVGSLSNGCLWLALCLYNIACDKDPYQIPGSKIVNSATGAFIKQDKQICSGLLSGREKEVLMLIKQGKISKEIAEILSISRCTVNRHRQNILAKLCVKNSFEACRIAEYMDRF